MKSIGFGLERIAWLALEWPRLAAAAFLLVARSCRLGAARLSFDENLRNVFASKSATFLAYKNTTSEFVDPENETLVLVEAPDLAAPAVFKRLQDFQFELQLIDGVGSAYSMFSLRDPPDASGAAALVIDDTAAGLTPALAERVRAHPILGDKLLSADGKATLYVVTPTEPKAPLSVTRVLKAKIEATAADLFAGTDVHVTVSGFPVIRAGILDILKRDQIVLNVAGSIVGLVMALLVFRSLTAADPLGDPGDPRRPHRARLHGAVRRQGDGDVDGHPGADHDPRLRRRHASVLRLAPPPRHRHERDRRPNGWRSARSAAPACSPPSPRRWHSCRW